MNKLLSGSQNRPLTGSIGSIVFLSLALWGGMPCGLSAVAAAQPRGGQDQAETDEPSDDLTIEEIDKRSEQAKAIAGLDDATQSSIQQAYEQARQFVGAALAHRTRIEAFKEKSQGALDDLSSAKQALASTPESDAPPDWMTGDKLDERLRELNSNLTSARESARHSSAENARRLARLVEIPKSLAKAENRLEDIAVQLKIAAPDGEPLTLTQARMTRFVAEQQSLGLERVMYLDEKTAYAATVDLLPLQKQLAEREVKHLEEMIGVYESQSSRIRDRMIDTRIEEIEQDVKQVASELKALAEQDSTVAQRLKTNSDRAEKVAERKKEIEAERMALDLKFETTKSRVQVIGFSDVLGTMLRKYKHDVVQARQRNALNQTLSVESSSFRAESFKVDDRIQVLGEIDESVLDNPQLFGKKLGELLDEPLDESLDMKSARLEELKPEIRTLLASHKKTLILSKEIQDDLSEKLLELLKEQKLFSKLCDDYSDYIDQHVLWIRSAKRFGREDLTGMGAAARGIGSSDYWRSAARTLRQNGVNHLSLLLMIGVGLLALFGFQPRLRKNILEASRITSRRTSRVFSPTATTMLETILLASAMPAMLLTAGWLLRIDNTAAPFTMALGGGLIAVGLAVAPLEFLRQVCREHGLADSHFDWTDSARLTIRKNLKWLLLTGAPLLLVSVSLEHYGNEEWNNSLGRAATILLLVVSTAYIYQVFRPGGLLFRNETNREGNFYRLRYLRFAFFVFGHLALIVFAVAGYYYTTYQLGTNVLHSVAAGIGLLTLYAFSMRLLLVRRRRLRYEQLVLQRETARKQLAEAAESPDGVTTVTSVAEALEIELQNDTGMDIVSVSRQAKELTGVIFFVLSTLVFWQIWHDALPATKLLDTIHLWQSVMASGETEFVTLRDLLISVGLFVLTFYSVRNIPGMLELLLLQRLPLDAGSRYAVTTIFRYALTVFGVILALNFLKIPWSKYSWLVAAISVGLGFGLQEIVANFVSGLIILLERPVRVGDVVTIDGTTGIVSRIQMRATTVTNWDNQELVVPNKDLITGKLMNWTLTSVVNRLSVKVGVAYGSNPKEIHDLIVGVALENSNVLNEPFPLVTLEEFGDNSLNFTLRCCITALEKRYIIVHQLNTGILEALDKANISIPFPQRDLHIISGADSLPRT